MTPRILQRLQRRLDVGLRVVVVGLHLLVVTLRDGLVLEEVAVALEILPGQVQPVPCLAVGGDGIGDVRAGDVEERLVRLSTCAPVSTSIRVIGPLTCVIAWVVWSLSQSTVPVGCSDVGKVILCDRARPGGATSWSAGTVNTGRGFEPAGGGRAGARGRFWAADVAGGSPAARRQRDACRTDGREALCSWNHLHSDGEVELLPRSSCSPRAPGGSRAALSRYVRSASRRSRRLPAPRW